MVQAKNDSSHENVDTSRLYAAFEPVYEAKCKEIDALQEIVSLLEETTPRPMAAAADVPCVAHLNMSQWAKVSRIKTAITYRRLKESEEV